MNCRSGAPDEKCAREWAKQVRAVDTHTADVLLERLA